MITIKTRVQVLDNSGAKEAEIIRVLKNKKQKVSIGDVVIVAIKKASNDKKVKKHDVKSGIVIQTKKKIIRKNYGITIAFDTNAIVILGKGTDPLGTRIKGPVTQELRKKNYVKILSIAPSVI